VFFSDVDLSRDGDSTGRGKVVCYKLTDWDALTWAAHAARWIKRVQLPIP